MSSEKEKKTLYIGRSDLNRCCNYTYLGCLPIKSSTAIKVKYSKMVTNILNLYKIYENQLEQS